MTQWAIAVQWWTVPPVHQVSYLTGADPELLSISLDPLPATAPAVVQFRPAAGGPLGDQVTVLLDELDEAAVALFPRWLPGAERLEGSQSLGVPAVRTLAARAAAQSRGFGPFLADLAERGLRGRPDGYGRVDEYRTAVEPGHAGKPAESRAGGRRRFPAEVRAAGLARVIADSYDRQAAALLIEVPDGLAAADEYALVAAAEWLAHHGRFTVWLAGAPLRAVDRVRPVPVALPAYLVDLIGEPAVSTEPVPDRRGAGPSGEPGGRSGRPPAPGARCTATDPPRTVPVLTYPPLSGLPRRDSPAEQALERALAPHEWAQGRRWNYTYEGHVLGRTYRLDLFWAIEGLVVEVDGPDHRGRLKFADDRRRDVQLQMLGHDVLRFTDGQVLADVHAAVLQIRHVLSQRRAEAHHREMRQHVDHRRRTEAEAVAAWGAAHTDGRGS
ncbi:MAG TPA: DUF559 domain-containing protein [Micromonosporaceae bacterium]|nr:DUF559 domain-containing protein [Micromonosporaceae bacterium]